MHKGRCPPRSHRLGTNQIHPAMGLLCPRLPRSGERTHCHRPRGCSGKLGCTPCTAENGSTNNIILTRLTYPAGFRPMLCRGSLTWGPYQESKTPAMSNRGVSHIYKVPDNLPLLYSPVPLITHLLLALKTATHTGTTHRSHPHGRDPLL